MEAAYATGLSRRMDNKGGHTGVEQCVGNEPVRSVKRRGRVHQHIEHVHEQVHVAKFLVHSPTAWWSCTHPNTFVVRPASRKSQGTACSKSMGTWA